MIITVKKILYFSGPKDNYDSIERLNAYKEAMAENHLKVTKDMIAYGNFGIKIEDELRTLLMKNKKLMPSCLQMIRWL